jgi:hypothetical protein
MYVNYVTVWSVGGKFKNNVTKTKGVSNLGTLNGDSTSMLRIAVSNQELT